MGSKKYKRGKIPLKHFGKRLLVISQARCLGIPSYDQSNASVYLSQELAYNLRPLAKLLNPDRAIVALEGLEREAYDQIVSCYLHSRERTLVGRAFTMAVDNARHVLAKIWDVNLVNPEFLGPKQAAFAAAEYYWTTSLEAVLVFWDPKIHGFEIR